MSSSAIAEPCLGEQPADILDCVATAYESRNFADYADLLAPDFELYFGDDPEPVTREKELEVAQKLFTDDAVESMDLQVLEGFTVRDGTDPMTWEIDVRFQLDLDLSKEGQQHVSGQPDSCVLHIRRAANRQDRLEIYRWWQAVSRPGGAFPQPYRKAGSR